MITDIFISYSRRDKAFVRALYSTLQKMNRTAWIDWQDIAPAVDWENSIFKGIENANKFIFIISADSVDSRYCNDEINYAIAHNKQLVPILCRETDLSKLHPGIAKFQVISFCGESDFDTSFAKLLQAIDTDLEHTQFYTRLNSRSQQWEKSDRDPSLLLRGKELASAEKWLTDSTDKHPKPTDLHKEYIIASQECQRQEIYRWQALYEAAEQQRISSEKNEIKALCKSSTAFVALHQEFDGLLEAIKAGIKFKYANWNQETPEIENEIIFALTQAVYGIQEFNRLEGHTSIVRNICFSPERQIMASCDDDGAIKLWRLDGSLITILVGHTACVNDIIFSPDGQILASASEDKTVKLWKIDGTLIKTFSEHNADVLGITFSWDGQAIASISGDGIIKLWQPNGTLIRSFIGHSNGGQVIKFLPGDRLLVSGSNSPSETTLKLWDCEGNLLQTVQINQGILDIDIHPNGQYLMIAGGRNVEIFDFNGNSLGVDFDKHENQITSICFSPNGQVIAAGDSDGTIKLSNLDGLLLQTLQQPASVTCVKFSPNNNYLLISAGVDGVIRFWHLNNKLFDILNGKNKEGFMGVSFNPNSQTFVTACNDGSIKLWNREGTQLKSLDGHSNQVLKVRYSSDGKFIASCSSDKTVKIWSSDGILLQTLQHHTVVLDISFGSDSKTLVSSGTNETLKLWKINGTLIKTFSEGGEHYNYSLSFSSDGQIIAVGRSDRTIQLWNSDGTLIKILQGHGRAVMGLSFSPDSQILASGSRDNTVKLWSRDGTLLKTLRGHRSFVYGVTFSPCGQVLASASFDKTIKLWRLDGTLIANFSGHSDAAWEVSFSPDGQIFASTGRDRKIILWKWDLDLDSLLRYGCDWLHDYLLVNSEKIVLLGTSR
ncbi:MAG: TIR domain-containing protein [Nostoc sp. ChiSLP02]|nr:TIR domain-containing protein [Nostoc sp. DedSLP05]MDZ8098083.1 TIR domain-containing protein [Nostoc sp. DedSLP01]MDZ8187400.1 TIR domain-containing protein [Nostoc sp. ChiSLP02]